jgi:hypothetical protein
MTGRIVLCAVALSAALTPARALAETTRIVLIKADGLPHQTVDEMVRERNPRTGQSVLPWIERVFYENGTRLSNFYVRGLSLSGPSWSMLDTGHHLRIRGNVEYDRYTQHGYDYLNFLPFWLGNSMRDVIDMWGASVLDDLRIPLLLDAYRDDERYQSYQLFQRGARWTTLSRGVQKRFTTRSPQDLVDEWFVGYNTRDIMTEQFERELIARLDDPGVRYLDYYTTDFDHAAHHNRDRASHRFALQNLDAVIGRIWTAISRTPQAPETALVLVSDHASNTSEHIYSQGFNLVHLLGSVSGGGHHVVTKRRLMVDYAIKGIYPFVPLITTTSNQSRYLKGKSDDYPTALLDFDGNERAAIHLRDSTLNVLHILLTEIQRRKLPLPLRRAAADAFVSVVDRHRATWKRTTVELREELAALDRAAERLRASLPPPPESRPKDAPPESAAERDERIRQNARLKTWTTQSTEYAAYLVTLERLLAATPETLLAKSLRVEHLIAKHAMGDRNSLFALRHYVVGPASSGLVLARDGTLDFERSFERVDYLSLLNDAKVRNNVQQGVSHAPVDFTVMRLSCETFDDAEAAGAQSCIWLNAGLDSQVLVLARTDPALGLLLRYLPVARLAEDEQGSIRFTRLGWRSGLPLRLWEDERLALPAGADRTQWLGEWHPERDWLRVTHLGMYGNAVVGVHEQFAPHDEAPQADASGMLSDEQLVRRFRLRQRALVEPDIAVMASNHWNFDVRGFNPGGNHGSFLRVSTHSTLMFAGGSRTGIPRALDVEEPYDSLSFVPTMLKLTGQLDSDGRPVPALRERGFEELPGRPIHEILTEPATERPAF